MLAPCFTQGAQKGFCSIKKYVAKFKPYLLGLVVSKLMDKFSGFLSGQKNDIQYRVEG